jgi:hypothetical protein
MKACLKISLILLGLVISLGANAQTSANCDDLDIAGTYQKPNNKRYTFVVTQDGCHVTVLDQRERAQWKFDLSASTTTPMASKIKRQNSYNAVAKRASDSMAIKTELEPWGVITEGNTRVTPGTRFINVQITMNLPKAQNGYYPDQTNPFDVEVGVTGKLYLQREYGGVTEYFGSTPDGLSKVGKFKVQRIDLGETKVRLLKINDGLFQGVLGDAFLAGANYVLDQIYFSQLTRNWIEMEKVK